MKTDKELLLNLQKFLLCEDGYLEHNSNCGGLCLVLVDLGLKSKNGPDRLPDGVFAITQKQQNTLSSLLNYERPTKFHNEQFFNEFFGGTCYYWNPDDWEIRKKFLQYLIDKS